MKVTLEDKKKTFHCGKGKKRQWEIDKEAKVSQKSKKDGAK